MTTRHSSSITALSWIPSEAIEGLSKLPFELGITHYDQSPPEQIGDLEELRRTDRFREANVLRAFIDVDGDRIVGQGYLGSGLLGSTTVRLGPARIRFPGVQLPDIQHEPEVGQTSVRFVQSVGGRMNIPTPRPVPRKPYAQFWPSIAWTTLELVINVDGSARFGLVGASPFPRHWIYDDTGRLVQKSGVIDFKTWFNDSFGEHTPWGTSDSPTVVTAVESALERKLSGAIMHGGAKPTIRTLEAGETLVVQGEAATQVYLVLDGMFVVEIDGKEVAEIGPGAVVGERAAVEGTTRTATLRATTRARIAEAGPGALDLADLGALAATHHREAINA